MTADQGLGMVARHNGLPWGSLPAKPGPREGRAGEKATSHPFSGGSSAGPGRYSQCQRGSGVSHIKRATPQDSHAWRHGNCATEGSRRQPVDCKRVCATLGLSPTTQRSCAIRLHQNSPPSSQANFYISVLFIKTNKKQTKKVVKLFLRYECGQALKNPFPGVSLPISQGQTQQDGESFGQDLGHYISQVAI